MYTLTCQTLCQLNFTMVTLRDLCVTLRPQCSRRGWWTRRWPGITLRRGTWGSCRFGRGTSSRSTARSAETRAGGRERPTAEWVPPPKDHTLKSCYLRIILSTTLNSIQSLKLEYSSENNNLIIKTFFLGFQGKLNDFLWITFLNLVFLSTVQPANSF